MSAKNNTDFSGQQFGNYELELLLKRRASTALYLGRDVKLDQPVYIEVLNSPVNSNPDLAERFQRRMEAVSQIKNDKIAPVIEIGTNENNYAYAVIEYIPGVWMNEMLADWEESGFVQPAGDALALGRDIADALSIGHSVGLIHHDLRPENILISDIDSRPVLIDLGVPVTTNTRNGVLSDSHSNMLDYAAPEELEGKSIGRRSNIYSLGILLYEFLTGHRPELPTSSWDIFEHSTMPKEVPLEEAKEGLSGETYRLVRNCLWRQEWSRFETTDEVISAIDTAMLAEQAAPKAAIWSDGRNRWLYVAVPLLALLVIVVGMALLLSQFANAEPQGSEPTVPALAVATEAVPQVGEGTEQTPTEIAPTVEPTATLTREAPPTSVVDTTVPIFGPLSDQVFKREETISFAWIWLRQPKAEELFTVYIESEDDASDPVAIGTVDEPDNASLYRLDTSAAALDLPAGSYLWQVRLENQETNETVGESDPRRFFVAEEPTATPTPITPTATATQTETPVPPTETATATAVVVEATATTAVTCVQQRPFGWIEHRVQAGESISVLAQQGNSTVQQILDANCLTRNSVLSINQFLYIPPPPATATPLPSPTSPAVSTAPPVSGGGGGGGGSVDPGDGGGDGGGGSDPGGGGGDPTSEPRPTKTRIPVPGG